MPRRPIRTKIVCTLGSQGDRAQIGHIEKLLRAGMDVARVNMSHSSSYRDEGNYEKGKNYEKDRWRLHNIREASDRTGIPVAILGDLQGPKVRVGQFADGAVQLQAGQRFTFYADPNHAGDINGVSLQYFAEVAAKTDTLTPVWLADGLVQLAVTEVTDEYIHALVETPGTVGSNQGAIFRDVDFDLSHFTDKDKSDLRFLCDAGVDFIALSYIRTVADVAEVRAAMGEIRIPLIGKIETAAAVANLDGLLGVLDGAMVARGDLGARLPLPEVPLVQKAIIERCNVLGLPVITATQMLDSMEERPVPTRAEVTDVANAILDGTDALMLSGETAKGKFPEEAIETLTAIAHRIEGEEGPFQFEPSSSDLAPWMATLASPAYRLNYKERNFKLEAAARRLKMAGAYPGDDKRAVGDAISRAAADVSEALGLDLILCPTSSGTTPRLVARYRPSARIVGAVEDSKVARQLLLSYGITPLFMDCPPDADSVAYLRCARKAAMAAGLIAEGEDFLFTAGHPLRQPGGTNLINVHRATAE